MKKKLINLFKEEKHKFPGQHHNEKVILVVRKHILVLLPYAIQIIALSILPIIFYTLVAPFIFPIFLELPYNRAFLLLAIIYYGFLWIMVFIVWVDYYLDIWIVTNQRLLNIEQIGFFNRVVSELDLKRIQDITSSVHGLIPSIFGFGNVQIQTAAEENKFELKSVPHPVSVRRKIIKLNTQAKEKDRLVFRDRDE